MKSKQEIKEKKSRIAEKLKARNLARKTKKQFSRSKLVKEADRVFSLYIRGRDSGKPCCTCGAKWEENHQAGHFLSRRHYQTRWLAKNCNSQCPKCNLFGAGEQYAHGKYTDKLYGEGTSDLLLLQISMISKVTDEEVLQIIQHYYKLCFELGIDYKPKKQFLGN